MTEIVKVFKNVNNATPTSLVDSFDVPILTTTATQTAVIKDVHTDGFVNEPGVTLDLDGFPVAAGQNMDHDGNLIMGSSSVLKLRVEAAKHQTEYVGGEFYGMFFCEGSTGMQYLTGPGTSHDSIHAKQITGSAHTCDNAVAAVVGGELFFYKQYSNNVYKFNAAGSQVASYSIPSTSYQSTTDGTYLYASYSSGNVSQYYRLPLDAADGTAFSTISTNGSGYYAPAGNQGSFFLYHDGKIYSRQSASSDTFSIIDLSDNSTTFFKHPNYSLGSYSDGACVVTTLAGKSYIVEQGQDFWAYYDLETQQWHRKAGNSQSSTEYGNGAGEIAPGIALIFGEENDRVSIIDMNTITHTFHTQSHGYTTDYAYGNRFGFAAYLDRYSAKPYTYDAYVSGILIEEG